MNCLPRFIQIHTLHSYPAALLNRDDSGLAKRLQFGGATRTRVSSQCLKRHWRTAKGADAWENMDGFVESIRSREVVTKRVIAPINEAKALDDKILKALSDGFQKGVYGSKGDIAKNRQPLLLGQPEVDYLKAQAETLLGEHPTDAKALGKAIDEFFKENKKNIGAMRENTQLPGGLAAALFGRMVTADTEANIDAAIHVAHAFTVHREESENDYFSVVDDLHDDGDSGAAHIGDMELTSGLFYGYVVVDVPALIANTEGVSAEQWLHPDTDRNLAAEIVRRLIQLIATVSPGAKQGSTAPYSWAPFMLIESSDRQPRSLADAFRAPKSSQLDTALAAISTQVQKFDDCYGAGEARRFLSTEECTVPGAGQLNLSDLSTWAADAIRAGQSTQ